MGRFVLKLYFLTIYYGSITGQTYSDMDKLYKNLTSSYNKNIRPTNDLTLPTHVEIGFTLVNIKEFVEKDNKLAITGLFTIQWGDFNMMWNPSHYGGISTFLIPQNDVWKPELLLGNSYNNIHPLGFERLNIRVFANGTMHWWPGDVYEVTCAADITYYPFDEHTCQLIFNPWMYIPHKEMTLHKMTGNLGSPIFFPSGQWELMKTNISIETIKEYEQFTVTITFRRRPVFILVNIFIPASVLGILTTLVFLLPAESGERVSFSITVLLALTVFLTIVSDNLPNTTEPSIPRMSYFLLADLLISTLATICAMLGLRLYHKPEDSKVPMWLQYLTCAVCWCCKVSRSESNNSNMEKCIFNEGYSRDDHGNDQLKSNLTKKQNSIQEENVEIQHLDHTGSRKDVSHDDVSKSVTVTWKQIASFCDVLHFVFFVILVVSKNLIALFTFRGY
ncbi:neuronal acetylcholine receptor subunit alpha-7-like [Pecten maximus]|uniref:neuronal acetylcholine receptor subunit alpha-7-like n=1 Tax=Pecten maximus TaxID=6579 RepID=UPI0014588F78|nr:neuronal acetylcholine receptor subunit alpha-7-like [Pecten maximus]